MKVGKVYIGTSGWQYSHWRGNFYPQDLPSKDWLSCYAKYFNTVEVNSSFYHQVRALTFEKWKLQVPEDFTFSVKGNRFITHIKRLKDCQEPLEKFFESAKTLCLPQPTGQKPQAKNVILWQLPPSFKANPGRITSFIKFLPKSFRHAFEFRHESWTFDLLENFFKSFEVETSLVLQDWKDWPIYEEPLGDFIYIRFHGREKLYSSCYSKEELARWSEKMQKWLYLGLDVYAYFNNDAFGYAVENAKNLKSLLG